MSAITQKQICVATGTRAEYGILKPLIRRILDSGDLELRLLVTGMHLCPEFGLTCEEIIGDHIPIDQKIEMMLSSDTNTGMTKSTGIAMISFADYFTNIQPDLVVVLGDRYEMFACAASASLMQIPIVHLHGGEATEGLIDEFIRHSITKMSSLHFTSCEPYRKRVIQLGESPDCVFNVGALSAENILCAPLLSLNELGASIGVDLSGKPYAAVTFHPVTLEDDTGARQLRELMAAMDKFPDMLYIVTKSNSDAGGREINQIWEEYANIRDNCILVSSLGMQRYLSALKYAVAMIGNSSSGIYEGPALKIPTVDIGDRQKGRIRADSIIHCEPLEIEISAAMQKAFSQEFRDFAKTVDNPYGDGNTSRRIVEILHDRLDSGISLKKKFYDIEFEVGS